MDDPGKLIIGVSLGLTLWGLYKSNSQEQQPKPNIQQSQQNPSSHSHIHSHQPHTNPNQSISYIKTLQQKLSQLNLTQDSPLHKHKQATSLIFTYTLHNLILANHQLKQIRNRMNLKRNTVENMEKYLRVVMEGMENNKDIVRKSKNQCYRIMGVSGTVFQRYRAQLSEYKHELKSQSLTQIPSILSLTLPQIQHILTLQIDYLTKKTHSLITLITQSTQLWPHADKHKLCQIISLIIIDEAIGQTLPHIDQIQIECAKKKYQRELKGLLGELGELESLFWKEFVENMRKNM